MVYTQTVGWDEFYRQFDMTLESMAAEGFERIVAIAQGGIIPAALIQQEWEIPMSVIRINYRDHENVPRFPDARPMEEGPFPVRGRKVLLVDDVSRTGRTISRARGYLDGNTVKTFLINGRADYSLFDTKECLRMPWKRD